MLRAGGRTFVRITWYIKSVIYEKIKIKYIITNLVFILHDISNSTRDDVVKNTRLKKRPFLLLDGNMRAGVRRMFEDRSRWSCELKKKPFQVADVLIIRTWSSY